MQDYTSDRRTSTWDNNRQGWVSGQPNNRPEWGSEQSNNRPGWGSEQTNNRPGWGTDESNNRAVNDQQGQQQAVNNQPGRQPQAFEGQEATYGQQHRGVNSQGQLNSLQDGLSPQGRPQGQQGQNEDYHIPPGQIGEVQGQQGQLGGVQGQQGNAEKVQGQQGHLEGYHGQQDQLVQGQLGPFDGAQSQFGEVQDPLVGAQVQPGVYQGQAQLQGVQGNVAPWAFNAEKGFWGPVQQK